MLVSHNQPLFFRWDDTSMFPEVETNVLSLDAVFIQVLFDPFALPPLFQVELMEAIFNFYASKIIYPSLNGNSC